MLPVITLIDDPEAPIDQIIDVLPGPDFPTGGIICGRYGIRQGYLTGRSTLTLRAKTHFETEKNSVSCPNWVVPRRQACFGRPPKGRSSRSAVRPC